jgi:hypothetical protein
MGRQNYLFDWLVELHYDHLDDCRPHIKHGRFHGLNGQPLVEGEDECEGYKGILLIANGDTLVERLKDNNIVADEQIDSFVPVRNKDEFVAYLRKQRGCDGAYIFNSVDQSITRVYELNNNLPGRVLMEKIPRDFVYSHGKTAQERDLGTKTRLAIGLPQIYDNVDAYQIKRTAYTDVGLGKVTHFNKNGLSKEFYFDTLHDKIVGRFNTYRPLLRRPERVVSGFLSREYLRAS